MTALLLPVYFLFFLLSPALAIDREAGYRAFFSPVEITIGDRIAYTVMVKHEPELTVAFALPDSIRLLPFVLIDQEVKQPQKDTASLRTELALFDIGEHALPPVTVIFRDTSGGEKIRQVASAGVVTVHALTDSSVTDLLPIKPLKQPYRPWTDYLLPVLAGVTGIAGIILIGYIMRRKINAAHLPADPSKHALGNIRKLEKQLEKGMPPAECYEQLSYLIREYLDGGYGINALEGVTSEIEEELSSCSVPHGDILTGVLHQADLVKFAESRPGKEECGESLDKTKKAISARE